MSANEEGFVDISDIEKLRGDAGTAMLQAAREGNLPKMKSLQNMGFSVTDTHQRGDVKGMTALHWTAGDGNVEATKWLLDKGASVTAKDDWKQNALHWATINKPNMKLVAYLVDLGMNVDDPDGDKNQTPLVHCIKAESVECVQFLLNKGASTSIPGKDSQTPLMIGLASPHQVISSIFKQVAKLEKEVQAQEKKMRAARKKKLGELYVEAPMSEWDSIKVEQFLELNGLGQYTSSFKNKKIDGKKLIVHGPTLISESAARDILIKAVGKAQSRYSEVQTQITEAEYFVTILNQGSALLLAIVVAMFIRRMMK